MLVPCCLLCGDCSSLFVGCSLLDVRCLLSLYDVGCVLVVRCSLSLCVVYCLLFVVIACCLLVGCCSSVRMFLG